jgi:hypothetical protein
MLLIFLLYLFFTPIYIYGRIFLRKGTG